VFHVRLIPLVLVLGPIAMALYWPRSPRQPSPAAGPEP